MPDDEEKVEKKLKPTDPEHPIQKQIAKLNRQPGGSLSSQIAGKMLDQR